MFSCKWMKEWTNCEWTVTHFSQQEHRNKWIFHYQDFYFANFNIKMLLFSESSVLFLWVCFVRDISHKDSQAIRLVSQTRRLGPHLAVLSDGLWVISYGQTQKRMATKILYSSKHLDGLSTRVSLLSPFYCPCFGSAKWYRDRRTCFFGVWGIVSEGSHRRTRNCLSKPLNSV